MSIGNFAASLRKSKIINSLTHFIYLNFLPKFRRFRYDGTTSVQSAVPEDGRDIHISAKVAFICDEMTWQDFKSECTAIFIHPKAWKKQLERFRPDFLFCESCWGGIDNYANSWRGRIYDDRRLLFDNRKTLLKILAYCKENEIPTVFWNKEDPVYFNHDIYDFTSTALLFDNIFTTATECVEQYRALGHEKVYVLPFGINTRCFYPRRNDTGGDTAIFAGSWFSDRKERCEALTALLDFALEKNWKLDIYDRKSAVNDEKFRFPQKYSQYVHPAVSFSEMPDLCGKYAYAINVNTVVDSKTMFSRRLLQMAACGLTVVSNDFRGLENLSDCVEITRHKDGKIIFVTGNFGAIKETFSTEILFGKLVNIVLGSIEKTADNPREISAL